MELLKNSGFAIEKNTGCFCEASLSLAEAAVVLIKLLISHLSSPETLVLSEDSSVDRSEGEDWNLLSGTILLDVAGRCEFRNR